jgi:hypothetical protein
MHPSDVIALVLAVIVAGLAGAAITAIVSLRRAVRELRAALAEVRGEALPMLDEVRDVVGDTLAQVERVDRMIVTAEGLEARLDSASRLAYRTIQSPVVKVMAFGRGVTRATQRFRGAQPVQDSARSVRRRARRAG